MRLPLIAAAHISSASAAASLAFGPPASIGPRWAENTAADIMWSPELGVLLMPLWIFANSSCATTCAAAECAAHECDACPLVPCRPVSEVPLALSTNSGASWALTSAGGLGYRRTGADAAGHSASAIYGNATLHRTVDARWGASGGLSTPAWGGKDLGLLLMDKTNTSWTSVSGSRAHYAYSSGELTVTPTAAGDTVTLRGLPRPAIISTFLPEQGGLMRLDSGATLRLADGTKLLTAIVTTTPEPAAHGHRPTCPWCL
jgi:hypothetical protein